MSASLKEAKDDLLIGAFTNGLGLRWIIQAEV